MNGSMVFNWKISVKTNLSPGKVDTMANLTQLNAADCQNLCAWCIYNQFLVKNRERGPDKNKFLFALGKLTVELDEIR